MTESILKNEVTTIYVDEKSSLSPLSYVAISYAFISYGCLNAFDFNSNLVKLLFYGILLVLSFLVYMKHVRALKVTILYVLLCLFGVVSYFYTETLIFVLLTLGGMCLVDVPLKKVFQIGFYSQFFFFLFLIVLSRFGFNSGNDLAPTEESSRAYRYALGFSHPNAAASYFFFTTLLYFCYKGKATFKSICAFALLTLIVYYFTRSRTTLFVSAIFFAGLFITLFTTFPKKWLYLIPVCFVLFSLLSYLGSYYLYDSSLNATLSGRLYYGHQAITTNSLSLFGTSIDYPLDNLYLNFLYNHGILYSLLFFVIVSYPYIIYSKDLTKEKSTLFFVVTLSILINGLAETYTQNMLSLPIVLFYKLIFEDRKKTYSYKNFDYFGTNCLSEVLPYIINDSLSM